MKHKAPEQKQSRGRELGKTYEKNAMASFRAVGGELPHRYAAIAIRSKLATMYAAGMNAKDAGMAVGREYKRVKLLRFALAEIVSGHELDPQWKAAFDIVLRAYNADDQLAW